MVKGGEVEDRKAMGASELVLRWWLLSERIEMHLSI